MVTVKLLLCDVHSKMAMTAVSANAFLHAVRTVVKRRGDPSKDNEIEPGTELRGHVDWDAVRAPCNSWTRDLTHKSTRGLKGELFETLPLTNFMIRRAL